MSRPSPNTAPQYDWINAAKAFAILGIILNHLTESFGNGPWFTNPSDDWLPLSKRMLHIWPESSNFFVSVVKFAGWLGDSGPGVFILLSGLGLTLSYLNRGELPVKIFYLKRLGSIFPFYIFCHLLIMGGEIIISGETFDFTLTSFLSLLGLRFTTASFFYLNPSWWFIWLIIQMYLVFPLLVKLYKRFGDQEFLLIMLSIGFVFRGLVLSGIFSNGNTYYLLTGQVFLSRLPEFALGMFLAGKIRKGHAMKIRKLFLWGLLFYFMGFVASLSWYTSVFSNLLVAAGLTAVFYVIWMLVFRKWTALANAILWLGIYSYGIYLIHQPLFIWVSWFFDGKMQLIVSLIITVLGIAGVYLVQESLSGKIDIIRDFIKVRTKDLILVLALVYYLFTLFAGVYGINFQIYRLFLIAGLGSLLLVIVYSFSVENMTGRERLIHFSLLPALFLSLFILPSDYKFLAFFAWMWFLLIFRIVKVIMPSPSFRRWISVLLWVFSVISIEGYTRLYNPTEMSGNWGELKALKVHPTRTYSLKENYRGKMHYNNYQYIIQSDSYGLSGYNRNYMDTVSYKILVIGDAFSMPEGLDYEESYVCVLEEKLREAFPDENIMLINGGVTGYGPAEQYPQMKELIERFQPDMVLYQLFLNEFAECVLTPDDRLRDIGLSREGAEDFWGYLQKFQFLERANKQRIRIVEFVVGKNGQWRYWKALLPFYDTRINRYYKQQNLSSLSNYVGKMKALCMGNDIFFLSFYVPGAVEVCATDYLEYYPEYVDFDLPKFDPDLPYSKMDSIFRTHKAALFSLKEEFLNQHVNLYFPDSWHWNEKGHEWAAEILFQELLKREAI